MHELKRWLDEHRIMIQQDSALKLDTNFPNDQFAG
jgi:hypothetical protein